MQAVPVHRLFFATAKEVHWVLFLTHLKQHSTSSMSQCNLISLCASRASKFYKKMWSTQNCNSFISNQHQNTLDKISNNTTLLYIFLPPVPPPFQCWSEKLSHKMLYTKPTMLKWKIMTQNVVYKTNNIVQGGGREGAALFKQLSKNWVTCRLRSNCPKQFCHWLSFSFNIPL